MAVFTNETANTGDAARLGLPRDLDGDGAISNTNVTANYTLLPIKVEVTWAGMRGSRSESMYFLLSEEE